VSSASSPSARAGAAPRIEVTGLTLAHGDHVVMRGLDFTVAPAQVFVVMGGSGSGKSTLLRAMVGLHAPAAGDVRYDGVPFWAADPEARRRTVRRFGVLYQRGALWSAMTLGENVALPLQEFTSLGRAEIRDVVALKLALVGLRGFEQLYPAELSGGMQRRAGLARAMALDPDILFLDEPSSGLDPVSAALLDRLLLDLRDGLGATFVVVSHDLASIFAIADDAIFLDTEARTITARGHPRRLLAGGAPPRLRAFLTREAPEAAVR
jgi:phospholipid/cholesterol/gamma-HCH transport system ATP-binding protein